MSLTQAVTSPPRKHEPAGTVCRKTGKKEKKSAEQRERSENESTSVSTNRRPSSSDATVSPRTDSQQEANRQEMTQNDRCLLRACTVWHHWRSGRRLPDHSAAPVPRYVTPGPPPRLYQDETKIIKSQVTHSVIDRVTQQLNVWKRTGEK